MTAAEARKLTYLYQEQERTRKAEWLAVFQAEWPGIVDRVVTDRANEGHFQVIIPLTVDIDARKEFIQSWARLTDFKVQFSPVYCGRGSDPVVKVIIQWDGVV